MPGIRVSPARPSLPAEALWSRGLVYGSGCSSGARTSQRNTLLWWAPSVSHAGFRRSALRDTAREPFAVCW